MHAVVADSRDCQRLRRRPCLSCLSSCLLFLVLCSSLRALPPTLPPIPTPPRTPTRSDRSHKPRGPSVRVDMPTDLGPLPRAH
ncbi:hypothetical protein C2E23DRAFT_810930 [Lenzites betulinus]|nr:hypothetical protein C2E23DRAFT_810930 [Lenzites betulinus]